MTTDPSSITPAQQQVAGRSLKNVWTPASTTSLPNGTFGLQVGDTLKLGGDRRLGYLLALQASRKETARRITFQDLKPDGTLTARTRRTPPAVR